MVIGNVVCVVCSFPNKVNMVCSFSHPRRWLVLVLVLVLVGFGLVLVVV